MSREQAAPPDSHSVSSIEVGSPPTANSSRYY
jgi:hypothetical protein